jgi:hypothetical protein
MGGKASKKAHLKAVLCQEKGNGAGFKLKAPY